VNTQTNRPTSDIKTLRDFVKFGVVFTTALFIGVLLFGWLTESYFYSVAWIIAHGEGELSITISLFLIVFVYSSFMSFVGYKGSVSQHKYMRPALNLIHKALILGLCLLVLIICMPNSM
jgi:hypothetical protein